MLDLKSPWLNAAGSLGFAPDAHGPIPLSDLGAFVTNPISLRPRRVAAGTRLFEHAGGVGAGVQAILESLELNPIQE